MTARIRDLVFNPTDKSTAVPLPYLALEHIEAGSGRLISGIELEEVNRDEAIEVLAGDVLFGKLRPYLCKVVAADRPMQCSSELLVFRPGPLIDSRYLYYLALSKPFVSWAIATSVGVKMPRTDWAALSTLELAVLPELEEQQRITRWLDNACSKIDELVAEQRHQRALLEERFRASLVDRLLPAEPPGGAPMTRLKFLLDFQRAGIWGEEPTGGTNDLLCIRVADFDRFSFRAGRESTTLRSVPEAQAAPRLLQAGDVLLEKSGGTQDKPVGCAVSYDGDARAVCSNFVAQLRPRAEHNSRFVGLLLAALYQARLNTPYVKQTTGIQNLDIDAYLGQWVWVPSRAEQDAIVRDLEAELELASRALAEFQAAEDLLNERKRAVITAAVTGHMEAA